MLLCTLSLVAYATATKSTTEDFINQVHEQAQIFNFEGDQANSYLDSSGNERSDNRPMIGVLTQPTTPFMQASDSIYNFGIGTEGYTSYLSDVYVKFIESAGGRAVPIIYEGDNYTNRWALRRVNGLILPGGSASDQHVNDPNASETYEEFAEEMYLYAKNRNTISGTPFPILGIAQGAQQIAKFESGLDPTLYDTLLSARSLADVNTNCDITEPTASMWQPILGAVDLFNLQNVFYHNHDFGIDPVDFNANTNLGSNFMITSQGVDDLGQSFVNAFESNTLPIWGIQFSPQQSTSNMNRFETMAHGNIAQQVNRYFADLLVFTAKQSSQGFGWYNQEVASMANRHFLRASDSYYGHLYFFNLESQIEGTTNKQIDSESVLHTQWEHFVFQDINGNDYTLHSY